MLAKSETKSRELSQVKMVKRVLNFLTLWALGTFLLTRKEKNVLVQKNPRNIGWLPAPASVINHGLYDLSLSSVRL